MIVPSFAHTTVEVAHYEIEVGWGIEPPIVGIRNDIVFKITEEGDTEGSYKGVVDVFKNLEATAMYGGATKKIDVNSDPRPGYYFSPIIPTKTGSYMVDLNGEIDATCNFVLIIQKKPLKKGFFYNTHERSFNFFNSF